MINKIGDIVYLCENEFSKFRRIYELIKVGFNAEDMVDVEIENRFKVILTDTTLARISFENKLIDQNFYNCVETGKYLKENISYDYEDDRHLKMQFTFPYNLLTVIK